ncbi:MAG: FkbM family methyltransferase [Alistipes sp.]
MKTLLHKLLYRTLPLKGYLRAVSRMFFLWQRLGIGRYAPATEYVYHLPQLVHAGDTVVDIGANLGYYTRTLSRLVGSQGAVYAVEPVPPILEVLRHNVRDCRNVEILPYALGLENKEIRMANDSARETGYFGTGQNFVNESNATSEIEFSAQMRRGSELFSTLKHLDFIKCDIEGYEVVVMGELRPLLERFHPTVLIETGGDNRRQIVALFTQMGYRGLLLDRGAEIPYTEASTKDLIFRYKKLCE